MKNGGTKGPFNYNIELLRLLAAFGIVLFHGGENVAGRLVGYGGLVVFTVLLVLFLPKPDARGSWQAVQARFVRLLVPWAAWSLIYGLVNMLRGWAPIARTGLFPFGILAGPEAHLWFLPFAFLVTCAVLLAEAWLPLGERGAGISGRFRIHWAAVLWAVAALAGLAVLVRWRMSGATDGFPAPVGQWAHDAPAVFAGLFFRYEESPLSRWIFVLLFAAVSAYAVSIGDSGVGIPYLSGTLFLMAFITAPDFADARIRAYSACALGVYLVHPLFYMGARKVFGQIDFLSASATFCVSLAAVYWARKVEVLPVKKII
ncbi:acyltransferase family protein [Fundidesulfovibrio terrae]|uniref:acyltransferase family protein n=1 Tax=Fundidesulfovibrio terrae TaxID=2922866 RepID=UPI001FAEEE91